MGESTQFYSLIIEYYHMPTDKYPKKLKELAKAYYFTDTKKKSKKLVILVHGFGASATETRPLGEFLHSKGYDVKGVLLRGHGTKPDDMDNVQWEEWIEDIQKAYDEYAPKYTTVFLGGISMGGALTLYSATKMKFDAVFTISPFTIYQRHYPLLHGLEVFLEHIDKEVMRE